MFSARPASQTIPSFRYVACPDCKKHRLLKEIKEDGTNDQASQDSVDVRGETRFVDVCGPCVTKYEQRDKRFVMENLKKIQKAMKVDRENLKDTDHKDFSLDI